MKIILSVIPMVILIITNDQEKMKYVLDMVHNTSGEKPYVTKYNDPEFFRKLEIQRSGDTLARQFHYYIRQCKKELIKDRQERQWIEQRAKYMDKQLAKFHKVGVKVYPFTNFVVFLKSLCTAYGDEICAEKNKLKSHFANY